MNIRLVRILNLLYAALIMAAGKYNLLWYLAVMQLSLEILNSNKIYKQHPYRLYNLVFWCYLLVLLERLRGWRFAEDVEWYLNVAEHIAFGIIICLKIYIYAALVRFTKPPARWKRALVAFVLFNIIGYINEIFQNALASRPLFVLIPESTKDLWMNVVGAVIFVAAAFTRQIYLNKPSKFTGECSQPPV